MTRKKETITLSIPPGTKARLEAIAHRLGIMWGKSPSISGLIVAIAEEEYELGEPFTLTPRQLAVLQQATDLLIDTGFVDKAQTLLQLMLDRGDLDPSFHQELMRTIGQTGQPWRVVVEEHRKNRQPFRVLYRNSQGEEYTYTVRYAQFDFHEKRYYLHVWCDETEDVQNSQFPELRHNRCLRLDRIQSIVPTDASWREEGLDAIEVQLHFYGGLVKAYEPKKDIDIEDREVNGVRQVVRRVANPFWLARDIRRYGEDCEVIAPDSLRQLMMQEYRKMLDRYSS
ncbi:MAG: WYL domain-containing protein [Cyanobacteria bacterium J007]|nr:MAG: WYL domain-containing protein [Cyanobacteria bacterium J007]